jgi:hypothetical protein
MTVTIIVGGYQYLNCAAARTATLKAFSNSSLGLQQPQASVIERTVNANGVRGD